MLPSISDGPWTTVRYTQNRLGWKSPLIKLKIKDLQSNQNMEARNEHLSSQQDEQVRFINTYKLTTGDSVVSLYFLRKF